MVQNIESVKVNPFPGFSFLDLLQVLPGQPGDPLLVFAVTPVCQDAQQHGKTGKEGGLPVRCGHGHPFSDHSPAWGKFWHLVFHGH
jgi:hypothetical protein